MGFKMTIYTDSHCHLDFPEFDFDRDDIRARCWEIGVNRLFVPGVSPDQWYRLYEMCDAAGRLSHIRGPECVFGIGIHPWWLEGVFGVPGSEKGFSYWQDIVEKAESLLANPRCVAVGECGLDKNKAENFTFQQQVLEWHMALAESVQKPLVLHCVGAHAETLSAIKRANPAKAGVVHAFSGSYEIARQYWDLGFRLGVGGTITYERAKKTRDAIKKLPIEALLLETDAPSMPLHGQQGERNSPLNIPPICAALAKLRGLDHDEVARQTTQNFTDVFGRG